MELKNVLKPVIIVSEMLAIRPFEMQNNCPEFKLRKRSIQYILRLILTLVSVVTITIYTQVTEPDLKLTTEAVPRAVQFLYFNCTIPIIIITLLVTNWQAKNTVDFLNRFVELDDKFKYLKQGVCYKGCAKVSYFATFLLTFKLLIDVGFNFRKCFNTNLKICILEPFNIIIPNLYVNAITMHWMIYLTILKTQIKSLNNFLKCLRAQELFTKDFARSPVNILSPISEEQLSFNIVKNSSKLYDKLIVQSDKINVCFSWQILVIVPSLFVLITYNSFGICQMVKGKYEFDIRLLVMDLVNVSTLLEIVVPCAMVQNEASRFVDILNGIDSRNDELSELLNAMGLQVYHQKLEFTSFGVFSLDGSLLYSMCGALTTYLVILLQFDN